MPRTASHQALPGPFQKPDPVSHDRMCTPSRSHWIAKHHSQLRRSLASPLARWMYRLRHACELGLAAEADLGISALPRFRGHTQNTISVSTALAGAQTLRTCRFHTVRTAYSDSSRVSAGSAVHDGGSGHMWFIPGPQHWLHSTSSPQKSIQCALDTTAGVRDARECRASREDTSDFCRAFASYPSPLHCIAFRR